MSKPTIKTPFFVVNPKLYLYGNQLKQLALKADELAEKHQVTIFFTVPHPEIKVISDITNHIIVTAQHIDGVTPGKGMGHILPESTYEAGARATFLNHAEHPLSLSSLVKAIKRADELGMLTTVCCDTLKEAEAIAALNPDMILCEETDLIGTGKTSNDDYITSTIQTIKNINPKILIMQAAGVSKPEDVYRMISMGADGTGCTSGIVCAEDPIQMLNDMIEALVKAAKERSSR